MNKRKKIIILTISLLIIGISTVYASTIINSKDVIYDNSKSNGSSTNVQGALDELYDLKGGSSSGSISKDKLINENMISYITNLGKTDTTNLIYDDTSDKNLRYIGSNPNNYIEFNGELWRVIGIMNNIKDSSGTSASRVKLIRAKSIGNFAWDNKPAGTGSSDAKYGSNSWTDSNLMTTLNSGPYWNRTSGTCYAGYDGATKPCDFRETGLTSDAKKMITSVVYNLGGHDTRDVTIRNIYKYERGTNVVSGKPTSWTGYVGLMYVSDYGYAIGGDTRSNCLNINISKYSSSNCQLNDWMYLGTDGEWTLTPYSYASTHAYNVDRNGTFEDFLAVANSHGIFPVVYLDTKLLITKGEGTESNPYRISFEKEVEITNDISNVTPPKLDEEGKLKPVIISNDGTVLYVSDKIGIWYNYSEKQWANAVILVDSPSKAYKEGDIIKEADIESYFVWIPKYKYKLWNVDNSEYSNTSPKHTIDIVFDTTDTKDIEGVSCKTPMTSGSSGNCNNGEYMTHPAFISLGVDGFWVGKFETGYKGATSTTAAQVSSSDSSKIVIKPNVYSWRSNTVYNFFVSSYNYERSLDSHMMKNTEWGAVAYLSHSKYGINAEINVNNNSSYKTGYSSVSSANQSVYPGVYGDGTSYNQAYNTAVGYLATTTGNISGIYDMSGGAEDYMASYISDKFASSGFTTSSLKKYDNKYFDVYDTNSEVSTYQYRILGDATGEMGPFSTTTITYLHNSWYNDYSDFVDSSSSWFRRGCNYAHGVLAGQFSFLRSPGGEDTRISTRLVLSP